MRKLASWSGLFILLSGSPAWAQASFTGLGGFDEWPGTVFSRAYGVSGDGGMVVGESYSLSGPEAFFWTERDGMVGLGDIDGGIFSSEAAAVSRDGSTVVGRGQGASPISGTEKVAFRYTFGQGEMRGLGDLAYGNFVNYSHAYGVSANGSVAVGRGTSWFESFPNGQPVVEAAIWYAGSIEGLGYLPGGGFFSVAWDVSDDGTVVVGASDGFSLVSEQAFRWTADGMVGLGDLPGGNGASVALGISADGSTVVGHSSSASSSTQAFRWQGGGMTGLGYLEGCAACSSSAWATSGDGSIVVGRSSGGPTATPPFASQTAFVWDVDEGMRDLTQVLIDHGIDMTGWTLSEATDVSVDGRTIVGFGLNRNYGTNPGATEAWIVQLPEPASGGLAVAAVATLMLVRTRRV